MRIVIAVERGLFRGGLASLLRAAGHDIVGLARDRFEAVEQTRSLSPDLVLLEIDSPRLHGLEAARLIKAQLPKTKVVLLTSDAEGGELIETLRGGVEGYVLKEMPEDEFVRTLDRIADGSGALSLQATPAPCAVRNDLYDQGG